MTEPKTTRVVHQHLRDVSWIVIARVMCVLESLLLGIVGLGLFVQAATVIELQCQATVQMVHTARARIITLPVIVLLKVGLIATNASLVWFAIASTAQTLAYAGVLHTNMRRSCRWKQWKIHPPIAKSILADAWPMLVAAMLMAAYVRLDLLLVSRLLGASSAGIYAAAVRLSEGPYFLAFAITATLYPVLLDAKQRDEHEYQRMLQDLFQLMVYLGVAIALPISLAADWIVMLLYGETFAEAAAVLRIHVWSCMFIFLNSAAWRYHTAENNQKLALKRLALGVVASVVMILLLMPRLGLLAPAVAALGSRCVASYLGNLLDQRTRLLFRLQTRGMFFSNPFSIVRSELLFRRNQTPSSTVHSPRAEQQTNGPDPRTRLQTAL